MAKFGDIWLAPKQGTDAALAMAMGHVVLSEWHKTGKSDYFTAYGKQYTDFPMLVMLDEKAGQTVPGYFLRASNLANNLDEANNPEWKTLCLDQTTGNVVAPNGTIGFKQFDVALQRVWDTDTNLKLRVRADLLNAFNWRNWTDFNSNRGAPGVANPTFGQRSGNGILWPTRTFKLSIGLDW